MRNINTNKRGFFHSGFTLIEMAVVLTIIALVAGAGLSVASSTIEARKISLTETRLAFVMDSIKRYVGHSSVAGSNLRLPCPASGSILIGTEFFGVGQGTENAGNCTSQNFTSGNVAIGVVPTATLGIAPQYMLDGWNRKFTYVVDKDLTYAIGFGTVAFLPDIVVLNSDGNSIATRSATSTDVTNGYTDCAGTIIAPAAGTIGDCIPVNVAVMVISHGKNGHGAWRIKGSGAATRIDSIIEANGSMEDDNAHTTTSHDATFYIAQMRTEAGTNPSTVKDDEYYDDIIMFRTKEELEQN